MRHVLAVALTFPAFASAQAQSITIEDLQGATIHTVNTYAGTFRGDKGISPSKITARGEIKVGAGGSITFSFTRTVAAETPKGTKTGTLSRSDSGTIGTPQKVSDGTGSVVWVLQGNSLVRMRTLQSGAHMHKISLTRSGSGWGCASDLPFLREVGGGNIKDRGALSTEIEILDIKQTGSSCLIAKN